MYDYIANYVGSNASVTQGSEPVLVLAIQWSKGGNFYYYADKEFGDIPGKILAVGTIENTLNLDGNRSSVQLELSLDDNDGQILNLFNTVDFHKSPVYLYQTFANDNRRYLIFQGEIVSNCSWDDKDRTFKLVVMTKLEDRDTGFSPEEGSFQDLPIDLVGKAWPMAFGTVIKAQALQITKPPQGVLGDPLGIPDSSLTLEMQRLEAGAAELVGLAMFYFVAALQAYFSDLPDIGDQMTALGNQCMQLYNTVKSAGSAVNGIYNSQAAYQKGKARVIGDFPYALKGAFQIGELYFLGTLTKSVSGISQLIINETVNPKDVGAALPFAGPPTRGQFAYVQGGSQVKFLGSYPVKYVVNILGTTIHQVYAYRQFEGLRRLTVVPSVLYEAIVIDTGKGTNGVSYNAVAIQFNRPLSYRPNEYWDDDIYVTYTSEIGPSFSDVITFLITTYTIFAIDGDSLASIPAFQLNFVLQETKNIVALLTEICWQCKVAIWIREGKFYFAYIPAQQDSKLSVTLSDVLEDTFSISFSPTENVITKMFGNWRYDYSLPGPNKIAIRYNIERYGAYEQTSEFYVFNVGTAVEASMSFWMYRMANTWKRVKFRAPLHFLTLENFDTVNLSGEVTSCYNLGSGNIPGVIRTIFYDPNAYFVEVEVELPIRLGSNSIDPYYWPSGQDITLTTIRTLEPTGIPAENWYPIPIPPPSDGGGGGINPGGGGGDTSAGDSSDSKGFFDFNKVLVGPLALPSPNPITGDIGNLGERINKDTGGHVGDYISPAVPFPAEVEQITVEQEPTWNYSYGDYNLDLSQTKDDAPCFPGKVVSGKGGRYKCEVYPKGMSGKSRKVNGNLLQGSDNGADAIPPGTWALFSKAGDDYFFQVPLWL